VVSDEDFGFYHVSYIQNQIALLFKKGNIKHTLISTEAVANFNFNNTKILVISDAVLIERIDGNQLNHVKQAIHQFVDGGGIVISFNNGIVLTSQTFEGMLKYRKGETTAEKTIIVNVNSDVEEENAFHRLIDLSLQRKLIRRSGMRRFSIVDNEEVTVLLKEVAPAKDSPLAVKFKVGSGVVYHFVEVLSNEITSLRSKEKAKSYYNEVEQMVNLEETKQSWKTAYSCGQYDSFYLAMSLMPFLEVLFGILSKHI